MIDRYGLIFVTAAGFLFVAPGTALAQNTPDVAGKPFR
jgi:hypothetical protein